MEIAFHCPNCLADLIFDESKKYTCCFCDTQLTARDEVMELEGGYYVGDAWNEKVYHHFKCDSCDGEFIMKPAAAKQGCPLCSGESLTDKGEMIGAMPRRAIPFVHTKQQAEEMFLDYIRNNSAVGRSLATDENKALLHKAYVPVWVFNYEVVANVRLTATLRNKAADTKGILGSYSDQISELLSPIRSSISRFQSNRKSAKDTSVQPTEHTTGGVLSWLGIPFCATGLLQDSVFNGLNPFDQAKLVALTDKILADTPVLFVNKDPIACMQEFMDRVKKWTRQMIMDAHSDSYEIAYFQDRTDYPLGIGELVLFPIWYMKGEYMGREFFFAMNGQNGEVEANIPMAKVTTKKTGLTYQAYWDKSRCTALQDTHFEFNIHDPNIEILDYSFFEKPKDSRVTAEGRKKSAVPKLEKEESAPQVEEPKPATASTEKKAVVPLDVQVVTDLKSIPKKLTKEEEARRAREMTARFREAAKESKKVGMEAAAEAPSWAKAVTPPPSPANAGARPVRKKKPAVDRPSVASSGNKPIWEKSPDELDEPIARGSKRNSMAQQIARGGQREEDAAPAIAQEAEERDSSRRAVDPNTLPIWSRPDDSELPAWNRPPEIEQPDWSRPSEHHAQQRNSRMNGGEVAFGGALSSNSNREERDYGEPAREIQVNYRDPEEPSAPSLVESVDDVLAAARAQRDEEVPYELQPQVSYEEETPEAYEIPAPQHEMLYEEDIDEKPIDELPEVIPEVGEGDDENTMATITFSFNKKNSQPQREPQSQSGTAIPRMSEQKPAEERGMGLMDAGYDRGVLPGSTRNEEEKLNEDEEEHKRKVSEFYIGRDANDRPLSMRPAAPLAQARDDVYVEESDTHPEDDINNRPLATRPAAPLAKVTEVVPNIDYIKERGITEEEDFHQIPSLASSQRWGEMPEAKETPSWAKPQEDSGAFGRRPLRRPSRDAEDARPAGRPAARRAQDQEDMQEAPTRPAASRPGASRPGAERPVARRQAEEAPKKQVPIWERVPEDDDRPMPAWGSSSGYRLGDERPAGALTKPKGQVIDVEKPRETRSMLGGGDRQVKEILPSGESREYSVDARRPLVEYDDASAREVLPPQRSREVERPLPPFAREEDSMPSPFAQRREEESRPSPFAARREEESRETFRPRPAFDHGDELDTRAIFAPPRSENTRPTRERPAARPAARAEAREEAPASEHEPSPRFRTLRSETEARERAESRQEMPRPAFDHGDQPDNRAIFAPPRSANTRDRDEEPARESRLAERQSRLADRSPRPAARPTDRTLQRQNGNPPPRQNGNPPPRRVEVQMPSQRSASDRPIPQRPPVRRPSQQEMMDDRASQRPAQRPSMQRPSVRPGSSMREERTMDDDRPMGVENHPTPRPTGEDSSFFYSSERPRTYAQRRAMEESGRRDEEDIPSLARGAADPMRQSLAREEETARRAMRGMPDYDPDGPSPFKPNN